MMKPAYFTLSTILVLIGLAGIVGYLWYNPLQPSEEILPRPDFTLPDLTGNHRTNSEWDGKVVVVNFWATWCPPCIKEIPQFIKVQEKYAQQGLQLVGIALDSLEKVQEFVNKMGVNYPILVGEEGKVIEIAQRFGNHFGALPFTVIIDRQGNMVLQTPGEIDQETLEDLIKPLL